MIKRYEHNEDRNGMYVASDWVDDMQTYVRTVDHIKEIERLKGGWISVDDNLPEERELVLVYCTDSGCVGTAWMVGDEWCISEPQAIGRANLTHWMPLPEPPGDV